jgi:hypothetical protein
MKAPAGHEDHDFQELPDAPNGTKLAHCWTCHTTFCAPPTPVEFITFNFKIEGQGDGGPEA